MFLAALFCIKSGKKKKSAMNLSWRFCIFDFKYKAEIKLKIIIFIFWPLLADLVFTLWLINNKCQFFQFYIILYSILFLY